jgi:hypothetical protein
MLAAFPGSRAADRSRTAEEQTEGQGAFEKDREAVPLTRR